jgi:SAM-dependent methyltransferase
MSETQRPSARMPHDFEAMYASTPPWDIGRPQLGFEALASAGALRGRVLDAGCGTGEHALMAAHLGLETTGIDTSSTAIEIAKRKAIDRGLTVEFLVHNALNLPSLGKQFNTVLDSGLFHIFDDDDRRSYVENLKAITVPGAFYFMLCFSEHQPGDFGPRRVTQQEIRQSFAQGWHIDGIDAMKLEVNFDPNGVVGWLARITRIDG